MIFSSWSLLYAKKVKTKNYCLYRYSCFFMFWYIGGYFDKCAGSWYFRIFAKQLFKLKGPDMLRPRTLLFANDANADNIFIRLHICFIFSRKYDNSIEMCSHIFLLIVYGAHFTYQRSHTHNIICRSYFILHVPCVQSDDVYIKRYKCKKPRSRLFIVHDEFSYYFGLIGIYENIAYLLFRQVIALTKKDV